MEIESPAGTSIARVARLIEEDLLRRDLLPDQRYLTAQEAGERFGVHPRMASRAMNVLAERQLLVRRRGSGTIVGPGLREYRKFRLRCVHVLVSESRYHRGLSGMHLLEAVQRELVGHGVQFNVLPAADEESYVAELLRRGTEDGSLAGLIVIGCGRATQELVDARRVPAVVFGHVYPMTRDLPSVDLDQESAGRLLARCVLERGHRRLAVMANDVWLPGDNLFLDGVQAEAAGRATVLVRGLPLEEKVLRSELGDLMSSPEPPTAFICRMPSRARIVLDAIRARGAAVPEEFDVVFDHPHESEQDTQLSDVLQCPHVFCEETEESQAAIVSRMLRALVDGERIDSSTIELPVRLVVPDHRTNPPPERR